MVDKSCVGHDEINFLFNRIDLSSRGYFFCFNCNQFSLIFRSFGLPEGLPEIC